MAVVARLAVSASRLTFYARAMVARRGSVKGGIEKLHRFAMRKQMALRAAGQSSEHWLVHSAVVLRTALHHFAWIYYLEYLGLQWCILY